MSYKTLAQTAIFILILVAFLAVPGRAEAGGLCGGTYIVDPGDTLEKIAATCGMAVGDIYTANPGISSSLYTGQTLNLAVSNPGSSAVTMTIYNSGPVSNNNYVSPVSANTASVSYNGIYIVHYGDTFSGIASRFGVSVPNLWAANPNIWNINIIYAGQVIHVPGSTWYSPMPTPVESADHLSFGTVPASTPKGKVRLSNQANADVYVSLQGTTRDGTDVINEYTVRGNMTVTIPAGWYTYVAWVGGQEFVGQFNLGKGSDHTITFHSHEVIVE